MIKGIASVFMSFCIFISSLMPNIFDTNGDLRIVVPENWEMTVGESRSLECVFDEEIKDRLLTWSVEPENIASVDQWGRVTALEKGVATITARVGTVTDSVELNVVLTPTLIEKEEKKVDYQKDSFSEINNLQKIVTRYPNGNKSIPDFVSTIDNYSDYQSTVTADGAVWEITDYGVLRTDKNAPTERDVEQRFMGDRYFFSADTSFGKVLAIVKDGKNGIWTVMKDGVTHIEMVNLSGEEKATVMSAETREDVDRHGFASDAELINGAWKGLENDNDGLWTSMYGAGELMRYATLKKDPDASPEDLETARLSAVRASEAILTLHYISMRTGTTEAYVRRQENGKIPGDSTDRWLSADALEKGGNGSVIRLSSSPADFYKESFASYLFTGNNQQIMNTQRNTAVYPESWSNPALEENSGVEYAKQTRLLEGFVARTFSFEDESFSRHDNIYWCHNGDGTATGYSDKAPGSPGYLLNNENLRGAVVDASGEIPERLRTNIIGSERSIDEITYKGDTSADEIIGHLFIFKLMYDILAQEDAELKNMIVESIHRLALHFADNGYMLVDGTGQPTTWSNFSRTIFTCSSSLGVAPLHSMVALSLFKTAAYITGYSKWENEYQMIARDPAYEYAEVASQYYERVIASAAVVVGEAVSPALAFPLTLLKNTYILETVSRAIINYSDEEMAMLAFYLLFQLEEDEELLEYYRDAIDDWWISIKYSENPLWYYIYQLAYPDRKIKDAYGNNIVETAAWSLSRSPVSTVKYLASSSARDDVAVLDLSSLGVRIQNSPSYSLEGRDGPLVLPENAEVGDIIKFILGILSLRWEVAAPDERSMHKFNECSYILSVYHNPRQKEASTVYTLPYWLGRYHNLLSE